MEPEPLLYRDEVTGIFFVITDISTYLEKIARLLEEEFGGEDSEDDA